MTVYEFERDKYEYAGFWIRMLATGVDTVAIAIITITLSVFIYGDSFFYKGSEFLGTADILINQVFPVVAVIAFWLYKSATPGKMLFGIKIVHAETGENIGFFQSIIRYIAYIPSIFIVFLGIFWIGVDERKQGWHDKIAKTIVIQEKTDFTINPKRKKL